MKVIHVQESAELCTEAGWCAYDLMTDEPVQKEQILALGQLGILTYLDMLSQPFYRVEAQYYMIKGLEKKQTLRVSMLTGEEAIVDQVKTILEK